MLNKTISIQLGWFSFSKKDKLIHMAKKMDKRHLAVTWILFSFAIVLNGFIIYQSCLNGEQSTSSSGFISDFIKNILNTIFPNLINEGNIDSYHGFIRKFVGHFSLFLVDGIITSWALYYLLDLTIFKKWWKKLIISGLFGLFMAALTETIQLSIPGRAGSAIDILIDYAGYTIGAGIILLIYFLIYRHHKKKGLLQ